MANLPDKPLISVVIPCYNHGGFLLEALASLKNIAYEPKEIIIVNDGSTEEKTVAIIKQLEPENYIIINQKNQGLGTARNNGIKVAKGKYILPLDADNIIGDTYFTKGVEALESDPLVSVVYGDVKYMNNDQVLPNRALDLELLIFENQIDACTLIRKTLFDDLSYMEKAPLMGFEDWMLWLTAVTKGYKFKYVNGTAFDYRVLETSMIRSKRPPEKVIAMFELLRVLQIKAADAALKRGELNTGQHRLLLAKIDLRLAFYKMNGGSIMDAYKTVVKKLVTGPRRSEAMRIGTFTLAKRLFLKDS